MCVNVFNFFEPHRSSCQQLHMLLEFLTQREDEQASDLDDEFSTINDFKQNEKH